MGASLLAIAMYQSISVLADPPLSRAGSLPHWDLRRIWNLAQKRPPPVLKALQRNDIDTLGAKLRRARL
ncbi:hypothetical protein FHJ31_09780 [Pseudomonas sp. Fig-3]|nr:hypothetical protein FHJ31_09780 [Pseudomonas sp. Fig-3]